MTCNRHTYDAALEEAAKVVESQCRGMGEGFWCSRHPLNRLVSEGPNFQPCRMHTSADRIRALKFDNHEEDNDD